MRITDARVIVVGNPWKNWVFVRLLTDEGLTGLGEATGAPRVTDGFIEIPERPGLGVELDETEAERHPYRDTHFLRLYEPGWETRGRTQ